MKIKFICILLFVLSIYGLVKAQFKVDRYSINPKIGVYFGEYEGLIAGGEFNVTRKKYIYSFDYFRTFQIMSNERFNQMDLMIGKYIGEEIFRFQFQGGLGTFSGVNKSNEKFFTIGIPLKLGFKLIPAKFFSIGVDLQAHLNSKQSICMAMFSIEFGKLRN